MNQIESSRSHAGRIVAYALTLAMVLSLALWTGSTAVASTVSPIMGQVNAFAFDFAPRGWMRCDGQLLSVSEYETLFQLLGTTYGGDGYTTFAIPDLRKADLPSPNGTIHYYIALYGVFPSRSGSGPGGFYLGETQLFAFNYTPAGFAECAGQTLPVNENAALFALLGTRFGGDGMRTYSLPDLTGAAPLPGLRYCIAMNGVFPSRVGGGGTEDLLGSIRLFPYAFAPWGTAHCQNQLVSAPQNVTLFSLIRNHYGGNGHSTFQYPSLVDAEPYKGQDKMRYHITISGTYPQRQ